VRAPTGLTPLAASAYQHERSLVDACLNVIPAMREKIVKRGDVWWVPNPVNPAENFADKWRESPRKAELFFEWLDAVEAEHARLPSMDPERVRGYLRDAYDVRLPEARHQDSVTLLATAPRSSSRLDVLHRERPRWPVISRVAVRVRGQCKRNGRWIPFRSGEGPLPKGCELMFHAETDAMGPLEVFWQVVNTGTEAQARGQLRGEIFPAKTAGRGGLNQKEATAYRGTHWIECFVVQNDVCVGRSGEYLVNIA
jgi:hypothetical protein